MGLIRVNGAAEYSYVRRLFILKKMISTEIRLPRDGQEITFTATYEDGDLKYTGSHFGVYKDGRFYAFCGTDGQVPRYKEVKNVLNWNGIHSE